MYICINFLKISYKLVEIRGYSMSTRKDTEKPEELLQENIPEDSSDFPSGELSVTQWKISYQYKVYKINYSFKNIK